MTAFKLITSTVGRAVSLDVMSKPFDEDSCSPFILLTLFHNSEASASILKSSEDYDSQEIQVKNFKYIAVEGAWS